MIRYFNPFWKQEFTHEEHYLKRFTFLSWTQTIILFPDSRRLQAGSVPKSAAPVLIRPGVVCLLGWFSKYPMTMGTSQRLDSIDAILQLLLHPNTTYCRCLGKHRKRKRFLLMLIRPDVLWAIRDTINPSPHLIRTPRQHDIHNQCDICIRCERFPEHL